MIDVQIAQLVPQFILNDKNGMAMARAIEAGLKYMAGVVQTGLDTITDVEKMPEWRLDEMAWELGCLYDYSAQVEQKRRWIRDSMPLFAAYGTVQAIYNYLEGVFPEVEVEEGWQYGAPAFHFRVTVGGEWTEDKEAWARRAIADTKNVRSVLDDLAIGGQCNIVVRGQAGLYGRIYYPMTGPGLKAGTHPQENLIGALRDHDILATPEERGTHFPYPLCGGICGLEEL